MEEKLEKTNKVLVNAKAGIEHLSDKLGDIRLESGVPNIKVNSITMIDALLQCEQKLEQLYTKVKNDPIYEEAIFKIRGVKKEDDDNGISSGARPGSSHIKFASPMRQSGYGIGFGSMKESIPNNIRVRLND